MRLAAWVWLVLQIIQGCVVALLPLYAFGDVLKGQAHGALVLMIGASCLGPVAIAAWEGPNRLLAWGTGAAASFAFVGAAITLADLNDVFLAVWILFNPYAFVIAMFVVLAVRYLFDLVQRRVQQVRVNLDSSVSSQGKLTIYVSRRMDA